MTRTLTAVFTKEDGGYVFLCPEVDVALQGGTVEEAKANLREAVELFFECASDSEISQRVGSASLLSHPWRFRLPKLPILSGQDVCRILAAHGLPRCASVVATS